MFFSPCWLYRESISLLGVFSHMFFRGLIQMEEDPLGRQGEFPFGGVMLGEAQGTMGTN